MREKLQSVGGFLAGMVIPNIGAFIAWGLITAIFIPTGWWPNENFAELVGPMINYLLPILIGYTGGYMVYGARGGVVGAAASMGVIVGAEIPMCLGAMIMGPLGGWTIKKIDELLEEYPSLKREDIFACLKYAASLAEEQITPLDMLEYAA